MSTSECRDTSWLPIILDRFANRTAQLTSFMKEKGLNLKNYYADALRNKITSYFGIITENNGEGSDKNQDRAKRRLDGYGHKTEVKSSSIIDVIAPTEKTSSGVRVSSRLDRSPASFRHVCESLEDDPAIHMTTPQLIALHGYNAESHTVVTDDGYILTIHRIPYAKDAKHESPSKTVLLHHGLLGSSADWIIAGPQKSLPYILSDAGYDVWLANVRGNTYSRAHVSRNINTFAFWNFTFHEVSQHDLPAVIDYIMEIKGWGIKIDYIGHSMGTTVLFALLSTKTQYNKVLRAGYALAPVAYMSNIRSPIRLLARFSNNIEFLLKLIGTNEFLPHDSVLRWLSERACEINHWEAAICENSMFVLCGHDAKQFNNSLLPLILGHDPAGASTMTLIHYAQEIKNAGRFQQFDYGPEGNLRQYGTNVPPEYPLDRITLPIALFSAENDWLASDIDVTKLYIQLVNPIEHYVVPLKEFNHIDFLWATDAPKLVYKKLLELLAEGANSVLPTVSEDFEANIVGV